MSRPTEVLRALVQRGPPFIAADCYSALTARIVEEAGFEAAYMGGHATGMMHHAVPDCGVLTTTEMIEQAARVAERISIPLIVDADQAGESVADVSPDHPPLRAGGRRRRAHRGRGQPQALGRRGRPVRHRRHAGPHRGRRGCPHRPRLRDHRPLRRALPRRAEAARGSVPETIRRGVAYAEAGADVFLPTMAPAEVIARAAEQVPVPIAGFGRLEPGMAFSLFTGWGTASAARVHAGMGRAPAWPRASSRPRPSRFPARTP